MGYYYDDETGFYYLNSRYYNPDIMRFISIDDSSYLDSYSYKDTNLYLYCYNNPVMYSDPDGCMPKWLSCILIAGMAIGTIAVTVVTCGMAAAGAEIQQTLTGSNYMSWLGEAYGTVKNISYGIPFVLLGFSYFAPVHTTTSPTGAYVIKCGEKVVYVGKGSVSRMYKSVRNHFGTSCLHYPCSSETMAFANEAFFMQHFGGAKSMNGILENKINSPGLARLFEWF